MCIRPGDQRQAEGTKYSQDINADKYIIIDMPSPISMLSQPQLLIKTTLQFNTESTEIKNIFLKYLRFYISLIILKISD